MSEQSPLPWYNIFQTIFTLIMTIFLAWYVNYSLRKKMYHHELTEKRLRELYRPMDIILRSSKMAFQRYLKAEPDEQRFIADLWGEYNNTMKDLMIKNAYLFVEPELPSEVNRLMEHIDAYLFDYQQYKDGKKKNPFPGERGYPFPSETNDYFANGSRQLVMKLGTK